MYEEYCNALEKMCIDVLKEIDAAGRFGVGTERDRVALGLCYSVNEQSKAEFLAWAKRVNPPEVYQRLRRECPA